MALQLLSQQIGPYLRFTWYLWSIIISELIFVYEKAVERRHAYFRKF